MHGRGKDFEYRVKYPDGETRTLLQRPELPGHLAALVRPQRADRAAQRHARSNAPRTSTTRRTIPLNPDPTKDVVWGDQSWDEMMVGFFNLVFDAKRP